MDYRAELLRDLECLEQEHEELNKVIDDPEFSSKFSEFTLQKFKKRKLLLKDKIKGPFKQQVQQQKIGTPRLEC